MRHQHHRDADAPPQLVELVVELLTHRAIDGRKRLVEQHHMRVARERPRQGDPLTLSARQRGRLARLEPLQMDERQPPIRLILPFSRRAIAKCRHHVAARRQMRKQRVILKHQADAPLVRRHIHPTTTVARICPGLAVADDPRVRRRMQPRDASQQRRLSTPGRPVDREHIVRPAREAHVEGNGRVLTHLYAQPARARHVRHDAARSAGPSHS